MKYSILAAIIVFCCFSCTDSNLANDHTSDVKAVKIALIDSLGTVNVNVPAGYDTSFFWVHYLDCNICHLQKYRVQSKKTPIIKESGFYWDKPIDSIDRFTIIHNQYLLSGVSDTTTVFSRHSHFKKDFAFTRKGMKLLKDTIRKINGRYFSIFELENSDSTIKKEVLAITAINGNFINFSYELMSKEDNSRARDFFSRSTKCINSIHIKKLGKTD